MFNFTRHYPEFRGEASSQERLTALPMRPDDGGYPRALSYGEVFGCSRVLRLLSTSGKQPNQGPAAAVLVGMRSRPVMVSVMAGEPAPIEGTPFPADVLADISVRQLMECG
jgi:hypothetical protein